MRFAIINYSVGNIFSIKTALERIGIKVNLYRDEGSLKEFDAVILPGVGGFATASRKLPREKIIDYIESGKMLIGICLGMQLFFERSEEGEGTGLSIFPGKVKRLPDKVKVPHIGWNTIKIKRKSELTNGINNDSWVYYVHSFYPETNGDWVAATTNYGIEFPCLIHRENIVGMQFHPEKSGNTGRKIIENIVRMIR